MWYLTSPSIFWWISQSMRYIFFYNFLGREKIRKRRMSHACVQKHRISPQFGESLSQSNAFILEWFLMMTFCTWYYIFDNFFGILSVLSGCQMDAIIFSSRLHVRWSDFAWRDVRTHPFVEIFIHSLYVMESDWILYPCRFLKIFLIWEEMWKYSFSSHMRKVGCWSMYHW